MLTTGHLLSYDRVFHFWTAVDVNSQSAIDQNLRRNYFGHSIYSLNFKWVTGKSKQRGWCLRIIKKKYIRPWHNWNCYQSWAKLCTDIQWRHTFPRTWCLPLIHADLGTNSESNCINKRQTIVCPSDIEPRVLYTLWYYYPPPPQKK